jgi:hypothetical protein
MTWGFLNLARSTYAGERYLLLSGQSANQANLLTNIPGQKVGNVLSNEK